MKQINMIDIIMRIWGKGKNLLRDKNTEMSFINANDWQIKIIYYIQKETNYETRNGNISKEYQMDDDGTPREETLLN